MARYLCAPTGAVVPVFILFGLYQGIFSGTFGAAMTRGTRRGPSRG
jgi:hypothetical protein